MSPTRRDLSLLLLPALAAQGAPAPAKLPSKCYKFEEMPVKQNGPNSSRAIFNGLSTADYPVDIHMTELAPGQMPHASHEHGHAEMIMIQEGTMEVTISGKQTVLGPGSVAYLAGGDHHGWKNVGQTRARYFVMALGRGKA